MPYRIWQPLHRTIKMIQNWVTHTSFLTCKSVSGVRLCLMTIKTPTILLGENSRLLALDATVRLRRLGIWRDSADFRRSEDTI